MYITHRGRRRAGGVNGNSTGLSMVFLSTLPTGRSSVASLLEGRISGFNQPLNDSKNHCGRYAEEKHSICGFQRA